MITTTTKLKEAAAKMFEFRKTASQDNEPGYRHPMMYGTYTWDKLPASEQAYYAEMVAVALAVFDIKADA